MDIEEDTKRALGWVEEHIPGRHHTSAAQAAASTSRQSQPGGSPMSTPSPFDGIRHFIDDAEKIGADNFARVQRIAASPYTLPALEWLDTLSGGHVPPEVLVKTLGALEGLHLAYPKPAPAEQNAA